MRRPETSLQQELVHGPVVSRRYGLVYGVNLLSPLRKNCGWNCVYCHLGTSDLRETKHEFSSPDQMREELRSVELECAPDALVVCGNGEPTLHPQFEDALCAIAEFRNRSAPAARLVVLTNGSELHRAEVRRAVRSVDEVSVKLDAGRCQTFRRVNLPSGAACIHHQARMIRKLHGAVVQACFLGGAVDNTGEGDVDAWLEALARAMPSRVDCYTLSRATACRRLNAVPAEWLAALAARVHHELGVHARAFDDNGLLASLG